MARPTIANARALIAPTTNKTKVIFTDGGVPEILSVIFMAGKLGPEFTEKFAEKLRGSEEYQTLKNVWDFVKNNVRYKRDEPGKERVKSPGKLIYDGSGDCKSFTLIIASMLTNLGIPWRYRVAFYDKNNSSQGHIYPVAMLGDKEVIVDAVHDTFDEEVKYWKAYDYAPSGNKLASLNGVNSSQVGSLSKLALAGIVIYGLMRI